MAARAMVVPAHEEIARPTAFEPSAGARGGRDEARGLYVQQAVGFVSACHHPVRLLLPPGGTGPGSRAASSDSCPSARAERALAHAHSRHRARQRELDARDRADTGHSGRAGVPAAGRAGAFVWGCAMAVLAILPAVGATLVWAPAAVWLALAGSPVRLRALPGGVPSSATQTTSCVRSCFGQVAHGTSC